MPIVIFAKLKPKPGSEEEVASIYVELARRVHEEEGCELYAVNTSDDGVFLIEKWASGSTLRAHADGEVVKEIRARTADLLEGPADLTIMRPHPDAAGPKGAL